MPYDVRGELLDVCEHNLTTLRALVRDLPEEIVTATGSGSERWSVLEIVCHLRDGEERALARVKRMVEEDSPPAAGFDPVALAEAGDYQSQSFDEALDAFEELRREHLAYLSSLSDEQWMRTAEHDELGSITVQDMAAHMAGHDCVHMAQISRRILETG